MWKKILKKSLGHGHYNDRAFLEAVGVHLDEAEHIFFRINEYLVYIFHESPIDISSFLMAMNFMKEYRFEMIEAFQFDILSTSTVENRLWPTLRKMDLALPQVQSLFILFLTKVNYLLKY